MVNASRGNLQSASNSWPEITDAYVDEFGPMNPTVYAMAGKLWPMVEPLVLRTMGDVDDGRRLMIKAVALVSRKYSEQPERLTNLGGYLSQTFRHLLFEEMEKVTGRARIDSELVAQVAAIPQRSEDEISQVILLHEILQRADQWTRQTLQLVLLGHSFDEIGREFGMRANGVRSRLSKRIKKLAQAIENETLAAKRKSGNSSNQ